MVTPALLCPDAPAAPSSSCPNAKGKSGVWQNRSSMQHGRDLPPGCWRCWSRGAAGQVHLSWRSCSWPDNGGSLHNHSNAARRLCASHVLSPGHRVPHKLSACLVLPAVAPHCSLGCSSWAHHGLCLLSFAPQPSLQRHAWLLRKAAFAALPFGWRKNHLVLGPGMRTRLATLAELCGGRGEHLRSGLLYLAG